MANDNRVKPRELDTRERDQRALNTYVPASVLPEPLPQPGWVFRWVMLAVMGKADATNVSKRFREGWEPVKAVDHPELQIPGNVNGYAEHGGLMLCKMPEEKARARDEYYARQAQAQMTSVDNHYMRNNDPRMPLFREMRSQVSRDVLGFGSGTK